MAATGPLPGPVGLSCFAEMLDKRRCRFQKQKMRDLNQTLRPDLPCGPQFCPVPAKGLLDDLPQFYVPARITPGFAASRAAPQERRLMQRTAA